MQTEALNIDAVKSKINTWRNSRDKQGKIPDYLWQDILSLIGQYKISDITKELGINTQQIKARMNELANAELAQIKQAHFSQAVVERADDQRPSAQVIPLQSKSMALKHDIEITRRDGSILKVTGLSHADVQSIIMTFVS